MILCKITLELWMKSTKKELKRYNEVFFWLIVLLKMLLIYLIQKEQNNSVQTFLLL